MLSFSEPYSFFRFLKKTDAWGDVSKAIKRKAKQDPATHPSPLFCMMLFATAAVQLLTAS